jgi:hypothetical protein
MTTIRKVIWHIVLAIVPPSNEWNVAERFAMVLDTEVRQLPTRSYFDTETYQLRNRMYDQHSHVQTMMVPTDPI